jgi:hypothetical protein
LIFEEKAWCDPGRELFELWKASTDSSRQNLWFQHSPPGCYWARCAAGPR